MQESEAQSPLSSNKSKSKNVFSNFQRFKKLFQKVLQKPIAITDLSQQKRSVIVKEDNLLLKNNGLDKPNVYKCVQFTKQCSTCTFTVNYMEFELPEIAQKRLFCVFCGENM